ncbi:MAG: ATP-binding protein, partial [Bacteroidetes bacterium]|nr:ATP-binding protein [Bacteroidota bacterium]
MKTGDVNYIMDLLDKPESINLEFKAIYSKVEIAKVICSFLNRDGGRLVVGVDDHLKIVGVKEAEKLATEIQTYLYQEIVPEPVLSVDIQGLNNKKLLVIAARQGTNQPYIFDGAVYYRKGSSTIKADSKQLSILIHNEAERNQRWEIKPAIEVEVDDINLNDILDCINEIRKTDRE